MNIKTLSIIAGVSYLGIFFLAIYANFFVLEALTTDPIGTKENAGQHVRFGALAFLFAATLDVLVAWALLEMYRDNALSTISTYFRLIHATLMGAGVFALLATLQETTAEAALVHVATFNTLWLIGLFFFGFHLLFLARIVKHIPILPFILAIAGLMYILDTMAQFALPNYESYADIFLLLVAIPAVLGEMSFAFWLLYKGLKGAKNTYSS